MVCSYRSKQKDINKKARATRKRKAVISGNPWSAQGRRAESNRKIRQERDEGEREIMDPDKTASLCERSLS
jgi:hypothetical protein